ncbi:MAG: glycosyltransferase [Candidatus Acidiferrales bacterium]
MIALLAAPFLATEASSGPPLISVVIPSTSGPKCLETCLRALEEQPIREQAEVIVVSCGRDGIAEMISRYFPRAKLLSISQRKTIPEMRAIGMKLSHGPIVSVIEDHCIPDAHWFENVLRAHKNWHGAVGGAVENDCSITRLVDWAAFFCEYSRFMNPVLRGEAREIPGNNASYPRKALSLMADLLDEGQSWDPILHARLREKGIPLYSDPSIVVYHKQELGLGKFLRQRFHYSRSFAGVRIARGSFLKRFLRAFSCVVLPPVLWARITTQILGKRRYLGKLVLTIPFITLFVVVWAWGEWVGYVFGPGASLSKVE